MKVVLLCLLIQQACECDGAIFIRFNITQGAPHTEEIRCVLKSLNTIHGAFGVRDENGKCAILTQGCAGNRTRAPGYTYLEKHVLPIFQSFVPPDKIGEVNQDDELERVWSIPGIFGTCGRLELYFNTGLKEWSGVMFRFSDQSPAPLYSVNDFSGIILMSIVIAKQKDEVRFKTYSDGWHLFPRWTPFPFEDGRTYKMTIVAQQADFQILFDGIERARLPYVGAPETMKTMGVKFTKAHDVHINNITFYGV